MAADEKAGKQSEQEGALRCYHHRHHGQEDWSHRTGMQLLLIRQ